MRRIILVSITVLLLAILLGSCEILKFKKKTATDSTKVTTQQVAVKDSSTGGTVHKEEKNSKDDYEWWKVTLQNLQRPGDTTITNIYPQTVIYEGGKGVKEESSNTYDTSWQHRFFEYMNARYDSLGVKIEAVQKDKHAETKGVGLITMILIIAGVYLLLNGLGFVVKNYSITKK